MKYWEHLKTFVPIWKEREEKYDFEKNKCVWEVEELITVSIYKLKRFLVSRDIDDLIDSIAFILMTYDHQNYPEITSE